MKLMAADVCSFIFAQHLQSRLLLWIESVIPLRRLRKLLPAMVGIAFGCSSNAPHRISLLICWSSVFPSSGEHIVFRYKNIFLK